MNLHSTKKVELGQCNTCGKTVVTYVAPIDFYGRRGTHHYIIEIEGHCGVAGHNIKTSKFTWPEMIGEEV